MKQCSLALNRKKRQLRDLVYHKDQLCRWHISTAYGGDFFMHYFLEAGCSIASSNTVDVVSPPPDIIIHPYKCLDAFSPRGVCGRLRHLKYAYEQ